MRYLSIIIFLSLSFAILATPFIPHRQMRHFADSPAEAELIAPLESKSYPGYDVLHYELHMSFAYPTNNIVGLSRMVIRLLVGAESPLLFDMGANLLADSVFVDGVPTMFARIGDSIWVNLVEPPMPEDTLTIDIFYHGSGGDALNARANRHGDIILYSFTEPDKPHHWFPCHDEPYDKATLTFYTTVPGSLDVLSNGLCIDIFMTLTSTTYVWHTDYPIATYLVSVAIGDYEIVYTDHPDSLHWYVYSEDTALARANWAYTADVYDVYSELFAPYPFEKYTMSTVPMGWSAMEHQTCTSMGENFVRFPDYWLVSAHELSHHWWGNAVTCGTWRDIWLNESFASYCEPLYVERRFDYRTFRNYVKRQQESYLRSWEFNRFPIYDPLYMWGATVYPKGSAVLDMLRYQMGDHLFFEALRAYYHAFIYDFAVTTDFIAYCEAFYGDSLDWFFDQWIYSAHTPTICPMILYKYRFHDDSIDYKVIVHQDEPVYRLKADVACDDGSSRIIKTVNILENNQRIDISAPIGFSCQFDPDFRVLYMPDSNTVPNPRSLTRSGRDVAVSWNRTPDWANIGSFEVMRYRLPDWTGALAGTTTDTTFFDIALDPGFYMFFVSAIWSIDTDYRTVDRGIGPIAVPEAGDLAVCDTFLFGDLADSGDCAIIYYPAYTDSTGIRARIMYRTGNVAIYGHAGSAPIVGPDSIYNFDFEDNSLTPGNIEIYYGDWTTPSLEQWQIYYFAIVALEPAVRYTFRLECVTSEVAENNERDIPKENRLSAFPNPFNSSCDIVAQAGSQVAIYDLNGRLVQKLSPLKDFGSFGKSLYRWSPDMSVSSGIYFIRADFREKSSLRSIIYMK